MNVTDARGYVRQFARNAGDSTLYSPEDIDRAIQAVCDTFIHRTRCTRTLSTLTCTADSAALSFSALTGFRPERLLRAYIDAEHQRLSLVDYDTILDLRDLDQGGDPDASGVPEQIAFTSYMAAQLYPTPDDAYTVSALWYEPLTAWTPGAADPGTLNLPDDYLRPILMYGATSVLQHTEVEHAYASVSYQKFEQLVAEIIGRGALGARVVFARRNRNTSAAALIQPA